MKNDFEKIVRIGNKKIEWCNRKYELIDINAVLKERYQND